MKKELFIVGTRPEIIKIAPILRELDRSEYTLLHTGQHRELAIEAFKTFGLTPDFKLNLMTKDQSLSEFVSSAIFHLSVVVDAGKSSISRIWVQGDTSSAYVGALIGNFFKIPVVHVEAGLRSLDKNNPWPEETFRIQIDAMSDILFAPTKEAASSIEDSDGLVKTTGNTIVDALEIVKKELPEYRPCAEPYVLATIHRRESFGPQLIEIFSALKELSKTIKVIIPAHPNPNVRAALKQVGLDYIEPLSYANFLHHLKFCEYVITDSGGIQEEAPSFSKKTVVLRKRTERPEAVQAGLSVLVDPLTKENILKTVSEFASRPVKFSDNPFGDGHAAKKIVDIIRKYDERNKK